MTVTTVNVKPKSSADSDSDADSDAEEGGYDGRRLFGDVRECDGQDDGIRTAWIPAGHATLRLPEGRKGDGTPNLVRGRTTTTVHVRSELTAVDDHLQGTGHRLQVGENGGRRWTHMDFEQSFNLKSSFRCGRATNMDDHASTGDDNNELTVQRRVRNVLRTNC